MNILILSTYDPSEQAHGGQIRVHEISQYLSTRGHTICNSGILSYVKEPLPLHFLGFPEEGVNYNGFSNWFLMDDAKLDIVIRRDTKLAKRLHDYLFFRPEIIMVEQPWLIRLALQYKSEYNPDAKIIYGSHNIEFELKETILMNYFSPAHAKAASSIVKEIELFAINNSDACIAVTQKDAEFIAGYCENKPIFVVPNGSRSNIPSFNSLKDAASLNIPRSKYALFCASAHPPNIHGFYEYLSGHSACLAGDSSMVILGTVGDAIKADQRYEGCITFKNKLCFTGRVSHSLLPAVVSSAHVNLLPISQGGGSNLKTAEALLTESYIVATTTALRGYEFAAGYDRVFVSDNPDEFKRMINKAFRLPPYKLGNEEKNTIKEKVHWDIVLNNLDKLIDSLEANR